MSILSGTIKATAGRVFVAGCDIQLGAEAIHKYVGICPQFDVVWNDLNVCEHLEFQARQRGIPSNLIRSEVQQAAASVGLDGDAYYTLAVPILLY